MNDITISKKEISLDLHHQGFTNVIYVQEGDTAGSRELTVSLFDDGENYLISPSSVVSMTGTRADGATINRYVDDFEKNGNTITIRFRDEELCARGVSKYKVEIRDETRKQVLSSFLFKVKAYENIYNSNGVMPSPRIDVLEQLIDSTKETVKICEKATSDCISATENCNELIDRIKRSFVISGINNEPIQEESSFWIIDYDM